MKNFACGLFSIPFLLAAVSAGATQGSQARIPVTDPNIAFSPYNWYKDGANYAQSPNPGAYFKVGFSGSSIAVDIDVSPFAKVGKAQYPVVRYSVDGKPPVTTQLDPSTNVIRCASNLKGDSHTLLFQYVAGYVFLDFWTPVNVVRTTGLELDPGSQTLAPAGVIAAQPQNALFLGDSITNGDDDIATFQGGITNAVDTQDATVGYPAIVASGIGAEYGIVAYGGASWDRNAADGHIPGLMTFYSMFDASHSRLTNGKLRPIPDDIFVNMGENAGPTSDDVPKLLDALRHASSPLTNIFVIVPFSGRSRTPLKNGFDAYTIAAPADKRAFLLDLGNNPFLTAGGPTMLSVDGQHPLTSLHAFLGAQLVQARAAKLSGKANK